MNLSTYSHVDDARNIFDYVLKLKTNLYGLKQASYNCCEILKAGLLKLNYKQRKVDPCMYFKDNGICCKVTLIQVPKYTYNNRVDFIK